MSTNLRPIYGTEGGRPTWQDSLGQMVSAIRGVQGATPVYNPYPAGTPTGQGNALIQQAQQHADTIALQRETNAANIAASQAAAKAQAPKVSDLGYSLVSSTVGLIDNWLDQEAKAKGKSQLDPTEVANWATENMPGVKTYMYEQAKSVIPTDDMEKYYIDIENYVNAKAGLPLVSYESNNSAALDALIQMIGSGGSSTNQQ